jgi:hypothetical protein
MAGWLWGAWVAVAALGWPLGVLAGLVAPPSDSAIALLAVLLGGAVVGLLQLLVLRRAIPGAVRDAATPVLFCGGWLLGALLLVPVPIGLFWEPIMESLLVAVPLSVGLLVGAFQQVALRRAVGPVPLWMGASSIGLMVGFSLALITGNIAWAMGLGNVTSAVVALYTLGGTQAAMTGTVLVRATAGARVVRGLAGGGTLAERSSPRPGLPLLGQFATAFSALPVLLLCGGLLFGKPVVRPDTTMVWYGLRELS